MFELVLHKQVVKAIQKLPSKQRERIKQALDQLRQNPFSQVDVKKMVGEWSGYYRTRIGKLRVLYWIDLEYKRIYVDYCDTRGDVYK
jgi:mRNA interferase RelE/StbE